MAKDEYVPFTGKLDAAPQFEPFDGTLDGEKPKEPGFASRLGQGASRAYDSARTALTDDPNQIAQIAAEQARTALPQTATQRKMAEEIAPYSEAASKAEGVVDNVKAWGALGFKRAGQLISNPVEAGKMIAEQLPNSLPGLAGGVAGAKLGAMAGTAVAPGVGTVVGGIGGAILGGFAGGYGLEKGAAVQEQVQQEAQKRGIDVRDSAQVSQMLQQTYPEIEAAAQRKGIGTAGTDALLNVATMGLAGIGGRTLAKEASALAKGVKAGTVSAADAATELARLEAINAARNTLKARALRGTGVVGAEMAGEGLSEAAGQKLAYGEVNPGEVIDESLMGIGTGGAMALGSKAFNKAAGVVDQDAATRDLAAARDGLPGLGPNFTTTPGAADPNAPVPPGAAPVEAPEAPDLTTSPGAGVARDGMDFTLEVDTSGLSLQDPAELERARAATVDYQPADTTPQWDTAPGAAPVRSGLDMPAHDFDTGALGFDPRPLSERMGLVPAANTPLTKAAALSVDTGASPVQFLGATGRDVQLRQTGPGVTNESNVIDVDAREVLDQRGIPTARRLTNEQEGGARATSSQTLTLPAPTNLREGLERIRAQRQEAANAQAATPQAAPAATAVPAAGPGAVEADGEGGEFSDLFDEQGRARFSNASSVKEFKKRTGLGQDGVRAIQAAVQDGRPITLDEARQADIAAQERRNAALEQAKSASEAESRMAKENATKPAEQKTLLGDYEIPGLEGAISRVRVFQQGERIEAVGLDNDTANNDLSRLVQAGQTVEQALATLYGDHGPNEAPNPSRVKRADRSGAVEAAWPATIPATTGVARESQASQTQQGSTQSTQAGRPQAGAATATASTVPAGGNRVQAAGLTNGTTTANTGAQAAPAAGAQAAPQRLPQGARLETADRGMVQGMVRYVDGAGLPLSDWAEDEADALAQAIQRGRGAPAEKLLRDHFVAAARADTAMQGNDAAQMLRMAQEREALVNQLVDAGYTQAEIGANSLGLPLEEFNRLVKEGIYSRERGAPDSLFPKRSNSRKAAAGPTQQGSVQSGGKQSAASGLQAQAPQTAVARPDGWRKTMLRAAPIARAMGIDPTGKRLAQVVAEIDARDTRTPAPPAPQPAPGPVRLGRNNQPLSEGGKPFKTRKAAGDAKKLQPMMRVVSVEGGYALAEKTPAQLAAEERASRRLRSPSTSAPGEPIPAHAFIAAAGGLNRAAAADLGVEGNPRIGNRTLFAGQGRGLSIEQATQMLIQDGYLSEGALHNDAYALIKTSLTRPQYNADGYERIAEAEAQTHFEDYLAAQEEAAADGNADPFGVADSFTAEELDDVGYTDADPALQAEVNALIAQADAMGIDTYAILDDIARTYANATQDQFNAAARDALAAAIARGNQNGGSAAAQAAPAAEPAQEPGLTAPTRADIEAQQEARDKAEREEAARQRAADNAASQDEDRKRIAQASVRAADTFELGQDPLDSLTGQGSMFDDAPAQQAPTTAASDDEGRERFTLSIEMFGDVPYRASKPVDAGNGDVVSSRVITTKTKLTAANAQSLGLPKDKGTVYAWRVSVIRRADGAAHSVIEAMATDNGRSPDGEVLAHFKEVENPEAMERIAPAIANAALSDWRAAQSQQAPTTTEAVAQPITRADVTAAQQQAATIIGERIDAMTAGEVNTIARRFLPTMGVTPTVSKERNKAAMTDPKINLEAAAAEVGATLPAEVTRALRADTEGRVVDAAKPAAPAQQEASKPKKLPPFPVDGYRLEGYYANGAKVKPLPAKAFSPTEVQAITDWFKSIGWSVTSGSGANGVNATNDVGMTVDDLPEPYTAAQRKKDEAQKAADERAADKKKAQDDYLASNDAGKFVSDMFGDSMNRFNLTALAKVLAGDEKTFGGLFSNRAADVLADAGISTEGRQVKDIVADIKATFDAAQQDAKNPARAVADGFVEQGDAPMFSRTGAKSPNAQQPTTRAWYDRFVSLLPASYRNDPHRREPLPAEDWNVQRSAEVREKIDALNKQLRGANDRKGYGPVSVDGLGNLQVDARSVSAADLSGPIRALADELGAGVAATNVRSGDVRALMDVGFVPETSLAAIADRLMGRPFAQPVNTYTKDSAPGTILTYKPRGFPAALFARSATPPADSNERNVATQLLVDGLKAKWTRAPEIIVARNMQDPQVPQAVRDYDETLKSQGATGEARGFIYQGKVYLLSDQLKGPQQIAEVLFHEVLGHYGLRGAFGDGLTPILQQIGTMRRRDVVAKAREYGLFDKDALGGLDKNAASDAQIWAAMSAKDRLSAAEEVLAEMAQTQPNIGFVQRAIAAIRNWLRANVPGFDKLALTDADIVQAYILPARGYVTRSKETGAQSLERAMAAFSRDTSNAMKNEQVGDIARGVSEFQQRLIAAQDMADEVRSTGQRLQIRADGNVSLFHSTSKENANAILSGGVFKGNTWFSASRAATIEHAKPKHGKNIATIEISIDPRHIEFSTGTGEFYAPSGLVRNDAGVWVGTNESTAPDSGGAAFSRTPGDQTQTDAFKRWFAGSRVVDAEGNPLVVYHGTSGNEGGDAFTYFDAYASNYGLMGQGAYFTDNPEVASSYTTKGKGETPTVYKVFLSIQNPIDMDAKADPAKWQKQFDGIEDFHEGGETNESWYRAAEDLLRDQGLPMWEGAETMQDGLRAMGFDGITHIGGGRVKSDGVRHRVYIAFEPTQVKSATGNNGNFDPANPDIRRSFAGQQAATADTMALATAQQRLEAGEDAEAVRQDTGWFKGTDGKWRFEISDADAKLRPALKSLEGGGYDAKQIASVTYRKREDGTYDVTLNPPSPKQTSDFVTLTGISKGALRAVLPDSAVAAVDRNEGDEDLIGDFEEAKRINVSFEFGGFNALPLDNAIDHPALFAAYPALRDVMVQVDPKLGIGGSFSYVDHNDGTTSKVIRLGSARQLSTLLHEIQHGIQDIEGFASGGSPNEFRDESADAEMLRDGAILAVMMRSQGTIEKAKALFVQRFKREPAFGAESVALSGESPESLRSRADNALAPHERYRRLAGEVEARNTQARQGMTDEQRRATPPGQTADVADSRVIVMFNGKEMANAPMPANAAPDAATTAQPLRTPAATIRAAITKAYGKLLGQLESKGLVTLTQTEDEAIEAAAQARAAKTGQSVERERDRLQASIRGEADELSMSIYSDEAGKIERALDAMGLQVSTEGSRISQSTYVIVESPEYTQTEGESGSVLKIRVSDHRLPGGYQQPDFEVQVGNAHHGVDMADAAGAWFDAVSWVGRRFGVEPKGAAKRQIAAAAEKEAKAKQAAVAAADQQRDRLETSKARLQAWLQSLPDGALWGNARRGGWVAVLDGKMIGRFDGETATGEGQPWYGGPYPVEAQKNLQPVRESLRASVKNSVADQTQTENFQRWFKDSKVVDAEGKPLVVYHGTTSEFNTFRVGNAPGWGRGIYFTDNESVARDEYAGDDGRVVAAYVSLQNPYTGQHITEAQMEATEAGKKVLADGGNVVDASNDDGRFFGSMLRELGYDGVMLKGSNNIDGYEIVAFRPEQIKSATDNNGNFDPTDPDIRRSADGSIQGFFDPQTGQSFLIADNLTAEAAPGVLMHEVGIHMAADGSMKALFNRAAMMLKLQRGNPFMKAVQARMDAAGETSGEEAAAYIAEAYENDRANAPASVQRWLADLLAAVKAWMFKKGIMGADRLTVADIAAVARANARSMARDGGATGGQGFGTAFSHAPAGDQTQTEAFKRWFAGSRVVDAEGKPLRVYHGTASDIAVFDPEKTEALPGIFMTPIPSTASAYASAKRGSANVMPLYVSLKNPVELTAAQYTKERLDAAYSGDADGIIVRNWETGAIETVIAFNPQDIKSAIGNNGDFDPSNPDIRFSRAGVNTGGQAATGWDAPVQTGFDDVIYKLQDKNIDLKRVVESITKATGQVADSINAYLKEELFHKRAAKRVADFGARELTPLMNQMRLAGLSMEDVEEYLHARHAKEANAVLAERNPSQAMINAGRAKAAQEVTALATKLEATTDKTQRSILQKALSNATKELNRWNIVVPYKGTEESRLMLSGMSDKDADSYFAKLDPAQRAKLDAVAKKVDAIIAGTRKLYVDYGLEDQAVVDGWASLYKNYIPLMREDKDGGMGIGQGFSVKGKEVKGRTGSTRKVVDILANIASQREKLIVRGEKNRVTQALVGLAQANPNPDFWEVRSQAPTERVIDEATNTVVERPIANFKGRDNVVVAKTKDSKGNVTEQMVVFNEDNPRAVRMAAAMKNLDAGNLEGLLGVSAKITRYFAAINTQYNPVFGVVNLVRDVQGAMVNLGTTPLAGQQGKIAKDTLSALRGIYGDIRKTRKGGQATSQWSQLWEQMQDDGGTTGYRDLFKTSADRANDLKSILNPEGWMDSKWGKFFTADGRLKVPLSMAQKGATEIFGWLSDYNEAMENGVRLAAYKAALDKGMSREQAASLAKNLTVNFNRKGQAGMQAGAVYAFFNAAMQGTARIGQTLFDMDGGDLSTLRLSKTGKAVVYGGVMLGVMQALALSAAGFDDDDPPEFVRERSLIIPTGDKTYVSIPMPLGLHVIPGIGRHATEFALSGFDKPAKRAVSMVGMFADAFNPIGNAGLSMQTIAPTALDPLVALSENKDWTGKPIARVSSNKAMPGHTQWKDTATGFSKVVAEAINWISGGNEYVAGAFSPTPDQIDYLLAQVGGGVAREAAKVQQTITTAMSGETLPAHKIPLVGRFVGNAASQASQGSAFYANLNKLNELETEIKGLRKDGRFDEASKLTRENPQSILIAMANRAERDVQRLRREKRELIANDASREQVRAKEDQITAVMTRLNEAVERRKAQAAR